jgi:hypothetical protein
LNFFEDMKNSIVILVLFAVYINAQVNNDCAAFVFGGNNPPLPDHGDFGTCGARIPNLGSCQFSCDSDSLNSWTLVGSPYTCNAQVRSGGPMSCVFNNYVPGKKNCSVSGWSAQSATDCSTQCGGGSRTYIRSVISYGEPGGEPCPRLAISSPCGTSHCTDTINAEGYYHWGPFCADDTARTIGYYVRTTNGQDIDLYVFDELDFNRYTWDSALSTPTNAYYAPKQAYLTTNFETDTFVVPAGHCYYLVVDHTGVGPTKGNNGVYDPFNIEFSIRGGTPYDGFSDYAYLRGLYQPATAARSSSVSFFGAFMTAIIVLILKLE